MKTIKIADKEYTLEYTIEASLYNDCTEKITNLLCNIAQSGDKEELKGMFSSMTDIPHTTLTMFYAGLIEHHGKSGDGTVLSVDDAKSLIKIYFNEHKDDETGNFFGMMNFIIDIMADDGFFKHIGLTQMIEEVQPDVMNMIKAKKTTKVTKK